jgi:PKHD-type hydroxylase
MMIEIPGVLTADEARRCREMLEQATWHDGRDTAGHLASRVKRNDQLADDDPSAVKLGGELLARLGATPRFVSAALPLKVLPPRFNRYVGSGTYGDHIDNAIFSVPGSGQRIRGDLSATLFFSEPDEYDGGELVIQGDFSSHEVKLPAGHMVLYPASTVHRVLPVTRGARLAAFFWIQSLVREGHRRAMLFEFDNTIQALAAETPDNPAVVRLTGLYHNLLRDWADT